jgi:hypothetical protein
MLGNYQVATQLVTSRVARSSIELASYYFVANRFCILNVISSPRQTTKLEDHPLSTVGCSPLLSQSALILGQVQGFRLTQHWFEYFILFSNRYMFRSNDHLQAEILKQ